MSDREDVMKHEVEDLHNDFVKVCEAEAVRTKHVPPAVKAVLGTTVKAMPIGMSMHDMALTYFRLGLEQGKKGKSFEDYTRCTC